MNLEKCSELFADFRGKRLFAGFSGGADSTALLLIADRFRRTSGFSLTAVHFDHGLRPESAGEAEAARKFAGDRGIPFLLVPLNLSPGANTEARARAARLLHWRRLAGNDPGAAVLLGHNADDRIETLLLRLERGSNASGLTGLRRDTTVAGVRFLRPLLGFHREEIETFLRECGVSGWTHDTSNDSTGYERNFLRRRLLAEWETRRPALRTALLRSLETLELDARCLENEALRRCREIEGRPETPADFWRSLDPALLPRVLRHYLAEQFASDVVPNSGLTEQFSRLLEKRSPESRFLRIGAAGTLEFRGESVRPLRSDGTPGEDLLWRWRELPSVFWGNFRMEVRQSGTLPAPSPMRAAFDAELLGETLTVGMRRTGDRMVPFGRTVPVPLRKLRCDRKLPATFAAPVLRASENGTILWAPGIRRSASAAVTAGTREIAVFECSLQSAEP